MLKQKMSRTIAGLALIFALALAAPAAASGPPRVQPGEPNALPTASKVFVNGKQIDFEAYLIGDSNFFKLRDLAYVLNGTEKQVEVVWDGAKNAISLISGRPYKVSGGEIVAGDKLAKNATTTSCAVYFNNAKIDFSA